MAVDARERGFGRSEPWDDRSGLTLRTSRHDEKPRP